MSEKLTEKELLEYLSRAIILMDGSLDSYPEEWKLQAYTQLREIVKDYKYFRLFRKDIAAEIRQQHKPRVSRKHIKQFLLYLDNLDKEKSREDFVADWFEKEIGVGVGG